MRPGPESLPPPLHEERNRGVTPGVGAVGSSEAGMTHDR